MSYRTIDQLKWAKAAKRPQFGPEGKKTQVQAEGLRYERLVAKAIPSARYGLWFEFFDRNGPGFCSPDLVMVLQGWGFLILECKLGFTKQGFGQLRDLYLPVLAKATGYPVRGAMVTKHLTPVVNQKLVVENLQEIQRFSPEEIPVVHWLGKGPIL